MSEVFLIATVGGSPEPLVASVKHWRPSRVCFVPSHQTLEQIEGKILPLVAAEGFPLPSGAWDPHVLDDAQDFAHCVRRMRELTQRVETWRRRGDGFEVVVDITGGTKWMSGALALVARRWPCRFSYVGGTERTKEGVGIVVSGKEQVLHTANPWNALGAQAAEDAITLFDRGACGGAVAVLDEALPRVDDPARKRELSVLRNLVAAYEAWERFEHAEAGRLLGKALEGENDLAALLGADRAGRLCPLLARQRELLQILAAARAPTRELVADLLANARRREAEKRHDDAVARLYRALEALAQLRLSTEHGIADTSRVSLDALPEPMRANRTADADGTVRLGMQDAYALLRARGDAVGEAFSRRRLDDRNKSNLAARNGSILAHGFTPVGAKVCANLRADVLAVAEAAGLTTADLPEFPRLGEREA